MYNWFMAILKKYWVWIIAIFLVLLYLWLRFNKIGTSFVFINDMGRDILVLQDWLETGKPPLLGPQTSALPINQSSFYFYMLMPAFLLTNGSVFSALYTNAFIYISTFIFGLWLLRKRLELQKIILVVFFLITISPQYVTQSRFVMNPSFVTPFLVISCICLYLLSESYSLWKNILFSFSLALTVCFSYSVAPVLIAINMYILFTLKKNKFRLILSQIVSLIFVNTTTIIFEFRHNFTLTNMLFSRGVFHLNPEGLSWNNKFNTLFGYVFSMPSSWILVAVIFFGTVILWSIFIKGFKFRIWGLLLFLTLIILFIVPLTIFSHFIFGVTTLLFLSIAVLPKLPKYMIIIALTFLYLSPKQINSNFVNSPRTVDESIACIRQVCNDIKEPIFVSVQSGYHQYHNGLEFRYLMKRAGCQVRYIELVPKSAKLMAVVFDGSDYVNGKTTYNELSLFGPSKEINRYNCQENFGVAIIKN